VKTARFAPRVTGGELESGVVRPRRPYAVPLLSVALVAAVALLCVVHLSQGTAAIDPAALWRAVLGQAFGQASGQESGQASAILGSSRLPRLVAGLVVGCALGASGAALQSAARNVLASPDTLAVNAGAYLAVVATAAFGIVVPVLSTGVIAFGGGLLAAAVVLALSGGGSGPIRLVLAGSALALALSGLSGMLLVLFSQETTGLFAWGNGTLAQSGLAGVIGFVPVVVTVILGLILMAQRLDILGLGDDSAAILGVNPRSTRAAAVVLAVILAAVAVTIAGPIGFVGLCAPALVRLVGSRFPGLLRYRVFVPMSALAGVVVVLGSDVLLRLIFGAQAGVEVPTGVVTTVVGAVFLVGLAYRVRDAGTTGDDTAFSRLRSRRAFIITVAVIVLGTVAAVIAAVLLGDAKLLLGDVANWATGHAGRIVTFVLDTRLPRVLAALLAGAALASAGTIVQAVSRNPLAEPGILGVVGGAGVGAVTVLTVIPLASFWLVSGAAFAGAALAALVVCGLAARHGLDQNRLVLIGIGVSAGTAAVTSLLIVLTDPYNGAKALVWLSGSTYGRTLPQIVPVAVILLASIPALFGMRRELDLIGLDADTPRVLGIRLGSTRLGLLTIAVALTATAVAAVGVVGFVGLVAPHAARALVGHRHIRVLPTAALLGAFLVCVADTIGRTLIAPAQIPVGLVTAVVGAPYFIWLLWRSRASER
jgi:ferric hydroxamate transport system permease protein